MKVIFATITITLIPITGLWVLHLFALIAEWQKNPVIELVEELRKKHSNTNEN